MMLFFTRLAYVREHFYLFDDAITRALSIFFFVVSSSFFFSFFSDRFSCEKHKPLVIVIVIFLFLLRHTPRTGEKTKNSRLFYRDGNELSFSLSLRSFFYCRSQYNKHKQQQGIVKRT